MTTAAFLYEHQEHRPLAQRASRLAAVVGLHAGLIACLMDAQEPKPVVSAVVRLEMRTIAISSTSLPESQKPATASPTPRPVAAKPVKRSAQAPVQKPVLTTVPDAEPVLPAFAATPAPTTPSKASGLAAAAGPASAPAPVAIQGPRFDADYLQNPAPAYPPISRRKREEGKVLLQVRVSTAGLPEQIQVKQTSGFPRLDEAAVDTVQRWRFVPARRGEETVAENVIVPIVFRLEG